MNFSNLRLCQVLALMMIAASVFALSCAPAVVREDAVAPEPEVAPVPAPPLPAHSVLNEQEFMQSFDEHLTSFPTLSATAATYTNFLEHPMEFFETLQLADDRVIYVRKAGWSTAVALSDKTGRGMEDEKMVPHKGKVVSVQLMSESPVLLMLTYEDQPSVEDSSVRLKVFHVKKDRLKEIEDIELRRQGYKPLPAFDSTVQVCQDPLRLEVERRTDTGVIEKQVFTWNAFKEAFVKGR